MKLIGLARIGKDVELRYTPKGDPVANISAAWNYGAKDQNGMKPTQWVDAALFGKRAESLAPFLKKGTTVMLDMNDVHVEVYNGKNGPNHKLCGKVENLWFAGTPKEEAPAPKRAPTLIEEENDLPF